jgi:restriction endonuclease S subunit
MHKIVDKSFLMWYNTRILEVDMQEKPLKDIAEIQISILDKKNGDCFCNVLLPGGLDENNGIRYETAYLQRQGDVVLKQNDIVIKRLFPIFVNLVDESPPENTTVLSNLVVVCARELNPGYVAYVIEQDIKRLPQEANAGTRFMAINRGILNEIKIPIISKEKQEKIGGLWKLTKQKQRLLIQLLEKEKQKATAELKQINKQIKGEE